MSHPSGLGSFRPRRRNRRGFNLLEVMIATLILVISLLILMDIQGRAVVMTVDARRVEVMTNLAQEKMAEVMLIVEEEGISSDVYESGDFGDFGKDADMDFGDALDDYKWEYSVEEIELELAADIAELAASMLGGDDDAQEQGPEGIDLASLGLSPEMLTQQLSPFIRIVRVRVYWGDDKGSSAFATDAEKRRAKRQEVELTTHVVDTAGSYTSEPPEVP